MRFELLRREGATAISTAPSRQPCRNRSQRVGNADYLCNGRELPAFVLAACHRRNYGGGHAFDHHQPGKTQRGRARPWPSHDWVTDADGLHCRRFGRSVACLECLLGDSADFTNRIRIDDDGALAQPAHAAVRKACWLHCRRRRRAGRRSHRRLCPDRILIPAVSGRVLLHRDLHECQRLHAIRGSGHGVGRIPSQGDLLRHGRGAGGGSSRAAAR